MWLRCLVLSAVVCAGLLNGPFLNGQSLRPEDLARGKILVSPRLTPDPLFAKAVILLVRFSRTGVVGLLLNRQTPVSISSALHEMPDSAGHADPVYLGGPVETNAVMALAKAAAKPAGAEDVFGHIYLIAAKPALQTALRGASAPGGLRVYLGYCGWAPGQLQNEMNHTGWYVFDGTENLAFDSEPKTLWDRLIARTELQIARLGFFSVPHK